MIELYELKEKTCANPHGSNKITFGANPFMQGPVLLCIGNDPTSRNDAKNTTRYFANVLRLRTPEAINASISMENFPINLVSYNSVKPNDNKDQEIEAFVTQYLSPLVETNLFRKSPMEAMKNIRNVNIVTFGKGVDEANKIEEKLKERLQRVGYTQDEIKDILSQVFAVFIGAPRIRLDEQFTSVAFSELEDSEIDRSFENPAYFTAFRDQLKYNNLHEGIRGFSPNFIEYSRWNEGANHTLEDYYSKGKSFPAIISSVIYEGLNNSVRNRGASEALLPLTLEQVIADVGTYIGHAQQGLNIESIMAKLDKRIAYPGMIILTKGEIALRYQLDLACDQIAAYQKAQQSQTLPGIPSNGGVATLPGIGPEDFDR